MKFYLALLLGKLTKLLIKYVKRGSGGTWPGNIAIEIDKSFLSNKRINFPKGIIVISGTNGKTTTAKLLTHFLESNGLRVTHNSTGGNILNGIASAILSDLTIFGKLKTEVAVLEVDELHLIELLKHLTPTTLLLLNLSRDQLDRFGEIDIIIDKWGDALSSISNPHNIIIDETVPEFRELVPHLKGSIHYFDNDPSMLSKVKLYGKFNAKNLNAALLTMVTSYPELKVDDEILDSFSAAYGRGEMLTYNQKFFHIFLAKNPASYNFNLETIIENGDKITPDALLFILNDEVRDGKDVSWIYDINPELLHAVCLNKTIYVSGSRAEEIAIRLQYAGVNVLSKNMHASLNLILSKIVENKDSNSVLVLPNYSAMLYFRKIVTGKGIL